MKNTIKLALIFMVLLVTACSGMATINHVPGILWAEYEKGVMATGEPGKKVGRAKCTSTLGLVSIGDCSIRTAMANGGISFVSSVETRVKNILGIVAEYETVVTGN